MKNLGKLTIILSNDVEEDLRNYVASKYPLQTYGKISFVIEKALEKYLAEEDRKLSDAGVK